MTDNEINVAIAECCGWTPTGRTNALGNWIWFYPDGVRTDELPDFANDLNAMRDARAALSESDAEAYIDFLVPLASGLYDYDELLAAADASARQRAEAFLRTKGKWKE